MLEIRTGGLWICYFLNEVKDSACNVMYGNESFLTSSAIISPLAGPDIVTIILEAPSSSAAPLPCTCILIQLNKDPKEFILFS